MTKARELSQLGDKITIDDTTGDFSVDTDTLYVDVSDDRVGIGTSSPSNPFEVIGSVDTNVATFSTLGDGGGASNRGISIAADTYGGSIRTVGSGVSMGFDVNGTERMRIDSSGNLLVGTTNLNPQSSSSDSGMRIGDGFMFAGRSGEVAILNRQGSDGDIAVFRKDGTTVGSIGTNAGYMQFYSTTSGTGGIQNNNNGTIPINSSGSASDNTRDLGQGNYRWDDVYATNGTIQTSDQNEKQQIASLTDAEITAAKAISKLFKTFKWNDSVAEKGDAARTHSGVIAQEVEQAMTDAGLNAGDYAFFISTTWWETYTDVPSVEANEENGVEAQEAYTRTDTYNTAEEAPEGATERNRKGIRYPQLLSFIGAATEQRLASIESRLDALESA